MFLRIEQTAKEPIVDLKFFKIGVFVNTLLNNFIIFMGMMGGLFLIPVFAQTYMGYDATQAGMLFIPMAAALMAAAPVGGVLTGRVQPRYVIAASTFVAAIGLYMFSFLDAKSGAWDIILPLIIMAFGMGFGMAQRTNIIASVVDPHEIGIASSVLALARNIAGAFGIAVFATILTSVTNGNVLRLGQHSTLNAYSQSNYQTFLGLIVLKAQVDAYRVVFLISAVLLLVGAIAALWIKVKEEKTDVEVFVE